MIQGSYIPNLNSEDGSINNVTILSTDPGRTDIYMILYSVPCICIASDGQKRRKVSAHCSTISNTWYTIICLIDNQQCSNMLISFQMAAAALINRTIQHWTLPPSVVLSARGHFPQEHPPSLLPAHFTFYIRYTSLLLYIHSWPWPWFNPHPNGCIGPHFDAILICFELPPLLPLRWFPSLTNACWLCSSSLHVDDLDLSWTPEPPSATPVEVCAGGPFVIRVIALRRVTHDRAA